MQPNIGTLCKDSNVTIALLAQTMSLESEKTVWQVATELVSDLLSDLARFDDCNNGNILLNAEEYDEILTRLSQHDVFELNDYIFNLLDRFGLHKKKEHLVKTLSGGQQTMLSLIRIMAQQPDILLLDEPTNNLDVHHQKELYQFLQSYKGAYYCFT